MREWEWEKKRKRENENERMKKEKKRKKKREEEMIARESERNLETKGERISQFLRSEHSPTSSHIHQTIYWSIQTTNWPRFPNNY